MKTKQLLVAAVLAAALLPFSAQAQLVREDDVKSIAGVLVPGGQQTAEWTFNSSGGEILFATLDAEIYRVQRGGGQEVSALAEEGCSDEGGPGLFALDVIRQSDGALLCRAEKPLPPPGWQRDPRMACMLPVTKAPAAYVLRVSLLPSEEATQPYYSFLLNVSLRGIAPSGTNIQSAAAASSTRGF